MVYSLKKKKRNTKKRGRKTKKKTGGATCRRNRDNCYDCTNFRDPRRRNKRCVYNLDTGDCRQKNTVAGRYHGRNDWTEGPCHRPLPTVPPNEVIQVANDSPILQRQFSDGGTPQAIPVLPGDQTSDYYRLDYDDVREAEDRRESICTRAMESAGECVISGGKRKKTKKKRGRKTKKKTGGATCNRLRNNCYDCTTFRDPMRRNKRCVYNLDTGDCRQKNIAAGRRHGHNDWTENADHCMLPTVPADEVTRAVPVRPTIQREFSDGGTAQAVPILPGDTEIDDNPDSSNSALSQQSNRIQISPESEWTQEDEREWRNALSSYRDYLIRQQQEAERRQEAERLRQQEEWERGMFPPYHPPEYWARRRELAEARSREPLCTSIMRDVNDNCVISGGKRKKTKRRKRKMRKKTRRKRGRGNTFKRAATATAVGALAMSNPVGAFKTKLPSRTEFNDAKFQLGKVCSTSREGKKLMRNLGLKFHPDKYAVALKPQATKYFQELTQVFGNGSCGKKSTSSNRKPNSSNRNSRGRKNKPKPKRKSGESAKKARTRQKAENNTIRNIVAGLGITVTTGIIGLVRKARRAYRIGYMHTNGNDNYIYIDIDGNMKRVGTKDFILYVSGLLVNKDLSDHIEDNIDMGEWIIDQSDRGL